MKSRRALDLLRGISQNRFSCVQMTNGRISYEFLLHLV